MSWYYLRFFMGMLAATGLLSSATSVTKNNTSWSSLSIPSEDTLIIQAVLDEPIHNFDGRRVFARAIVTKENGTYHARLTGNQSSNLLTSMARANGLAICPEDMPVKEAGEVVEVQMLDWPEEVF